MEKYFTEEDGKVILQTIRNTLSVLNSQDISDEAKLETSDIQLKAILESLSLSAPEIHPGLGELNLPCYKESAETGIEDFNSKVKESQMICCFAWNSESLLANHLARGYKNSNTYSLTIKKIEKADKEAEKEYKQWSLMSREERAYKIYQVMLDNNDKSGLKAIVAQSLASLLKWDISWLMRKNGRL